MRIKVKVKPGAKFEKIERDMEGSLKIWVKEPAKEGRANFEVITLLSKYFNVTRSSIKIIAGATSRNKVVDIVSGK